MASTEKPSVRTETDSMGPIDIPNDRYWGAQTQRAITHFAIGNITMPLEVIHALALVKKAAAITNKELGTLDAGKAALIIQAANEVIAGQWDDHFPLKVWISGSGTQSNMNVNEVIANRAIELAGGTIGSKSPVHPNDDVNLSQSTNDVFPTAMHLVVASMINARLLPSLKHLRDALQDKAFEWADIVKIGRTHLQDAVPLTLGQEFSAFVAMLDDNAHQLQDQLTTIYPLAIGGTAVGTGINAPPGYAKQVCSKLAELTGLPFCPAPNRFAVMGSHDALVMTSGVLRTLAVSLYKIANDIRLLACGPRAGLSELALPANEPGSSIMPGKVNPTQCESLAMVATQVMGFDSATGFAGAGGALQMNVYKPQIIFNLVQSIRLLSDGCYSFTEHLVQGMTANQARIDDLVQQSLMLVTALAPHIGYDKAAQVAHYAHEHQTTLRDAALTLGFISGADFDEVVDPAKMVGS